MSTIKCGKCGADIPEKSKFCLECGSPIETQDSQNKTYKHRLSHYSYGNNQSCAGKSDIVVRNGFVYFITKKKDAINIKVAPISDNDMVQTLYKSMGPGCSASSLNMVEDELIFYEFSDGDKISALDVYSGEKRVILENHAASSIWIENDLIIFVENGELKSVHLSGSEYMEYDLPFKVEDRIFGYSGNLYVISADSREVYEIPYEKSEYRSMNFTAGTDMIHAIIGNIYYSPAKFIPDDSVILSRNIETLEIRNGIQDVHRMLTAFEQYIIFSRKDEEKFSFAWNIQTLRVYSLNRYIDIPPYSFTQALSDYIIMENSGNLYKIPAPVFFQGDEPMFADKYKFVSLCSE